MFKLSCDITIGPYHLDAVHEVTVESSWDDLTDTCTIKLPRNNKWRDRYLAHGDDPVFKRGMPVLVKLGYGGTNTEVFRGYLRDVKTSVPIELVCEDEMYLLKRTEFTKSYRSVTLKQFVTDAVGKTMPFEVVGNQNLGALRFSQVSPAQALKTLREKRFVKAWCREGVLYVGWVTLPKLQRERVFAFGKNIVSDTLEWRVLEDVKIRLKGIIMYPTEGKRDKKKELSMGPPDGEERTFHAYNVPESEMKKLMAQEIERLRFTGYRGDFTTFGMPDVRHGDIITLRDEQFDRVGKSLCKAVKVTFGTQGYRQEITLEGEAKSSSQ